MDRIYLVLECDTCGEDMFYGPCGSLLDHRDGIPVFPADIASTTRFDCEHCGGVTYTGDFYDFLENEEGEIPDDEDDEDSEEDDESDEEDGS